MSLRVPSPSLRVPPTYETYLRWILNQSRGSAAWRDVTVARVYLTPVQVPFDLYVDRLWFVGRNQAGNMHGGIYKDNGDTPAGGEVVLDSGSVSTPTTLGGCYIDLTETFLERGQYWVALEFDNALVDILEMIYYGPPRSPTGYGGVYYDRPGGYGALIDPCPAVTEWYPYHIALRVSKMG